MQLHDVIARLVTQRRAFVWCGIAILSVACVAILVSQLKLDSDVLNMLPRNFDSVEGLKIYNRDFAQTRELTFALLCQPTDVDKLEEFAPQFAEHLRRQPWCVRVLAGSPMETPDGVRDLQSIAVPLLLNLAPAAFEETISVLRPERIRERLHRFHQQIQAGSPRAEFELAFDPLGLIAPALKPFAESHAIEEDQPLASSDETMRLFLVVTNQTSIGAFECQRLMREVDAFLTHAREGWGGGQLEILVTGRAAFVAEISLSMRHDIFVTVLGSILLVAGIFYAGFRRWLPLLGMAFSLLFCCLAALTIGLLIFGRLHMVTIGFCAILVGLGVDFAILIFGRYEQARDEGIEHRQAIADAIKNLGRAIFFGALTTAVGFLALILSNSTGFIQFGVLIAIGIMLAGLAMTTFFFLFIPQRHPQSREDWIRRAVTKYVTRALRAPASILWLVTPALIILLVLAAVPKPPIPFDASSRALQPKNSKAGHALESIMRKMPTGWEPVIGIVRASDQQQLHDYWQATSTHWSDLQAAGKIRRFSTPAALALSPARMRKNQEQLQSIDLATSRSALEKALDAEGFSREAFAPAFKLFDDLQQLFDPNVAPPSWREKLPQSSSWWFLIDRYFAENPLLTTGFVMTNEPVAAPAQKEFLQRELPAPGVPLTLSGWSFTLTDLIPWSQRQLILISGLMALFDALLLAVLYRDCRLWTIQMITLVFAVGAMIASMKLLHVPLTLLNVLSFRLVLAIGVDYGIYVLLVWQTSRERERDVAGVVKPVVLAGLTAIVGFGSLGFAQNPSLSGLGIACAIGLFWSLVATIFFTLPAAAAIEPTISRAGKIDPLRAKAAD